MISRTRKRRRSHQTAAPFGCLNRDLEVVLTVLGILLILVLVVVLLVLIVLLVVHDVPPVQ